MIAEKGAAMVLEDAVAAEPTLAIAS
jgi:hypothetical protein